MSEDFQHLVMHIFNGLIVDEPDASPSTTAARDQADALQRDLARDMKAALAQVTQGHEPTAIADDDREGWLRLLSLNLAMAQVREVAVCPHINADLEVGVYPSAQPNFLSMVIGMWHCADCFPALEDAESLQTPGCDVCGEVPPDNGFWDQAWVAGGTAVMGSYCDECIKVIGRWSGSMESGAA